MSKRRFVMTAPQQEFFNLTDKYPAFVAGFGSGKSETMANCAVRDAYMSSSAVIALYEPTYDLIRLIMAPRMESKLAEMGVRYRYNKSENIIYTSSGGIGDFILRTLDNPVRIVGYESFRAHVDELDVLPEVKAQLAWQKIIARNRQRIVMRSRETGKLVRQMNRVSAYTTPEGFKFTYKTWKKSPKKGYRLLQARTASNPFLPDDYIDGLRASYPPQLIEAYLNGEFVNLTQGTVYLCFDREQNVKPCAYNPKLPIHIGMDFNVNPMSASVHQEQPNGEVWCIGEIVLMSSNTHEMAKEIKDRYGRASFDPTKRDVSHITIYPDPAGTQQKTSAQGLTDILILQSAGFNVIHMEAHPLIRDRINFVNGWLLNSLYQRRYFVDPSCETVIENFEQLTYDPLTGQPDKKSGADHMPDSIGYYLYTKHCYIPAQNATSHHQAR
ncbi:terminase large subunit domain-containing protein [Paraburkholderia phosphatilytica]|uniref:terminase large subunit domain-containing protein n=1 Tax=Paraburkholderia phosphatilytica TaxID=2282883 RepID=UPI0019815ECF|nr:terminase family protein [Paraburkholderia phosphatilytica]